MPTCFFLLTIQLISFWPVWRWYVSRITDGSDEPWGGIALIAALLLLHLTKRKIDTINNRLYLPAVLTLLYAISYGFVTPLLRAIIAIMAVAILLCRTVYGDKLRVGIIGLFLLSLPLTASLQFYLGYPLRSLTATIVAPLIRFGGLPVIAEGVTLIWNDKSILIDAPCSGVKMMWVGIVLACVLSVIFNLNNLRTLFAITISIILIVIGNIMRSMTLFYTESGVIELPLWMHEAIGAMAFLYTSIIIAISIRKLRGKKICEA